MKKISKILIVALTLAVLLCSAFAISASATQTDDVVAASEDGGKWVISKNVSYSENIHLLLAIDANKVKDPNLLSVKISVPGVDAAVEEFARYEFEEDLYGKFDEGAVPAYLVHTLGVAAKDMADELTIEIIYDGAPVETITYSVAEYFFERLYKDEFILASEGEALDRKELYLASLKYGNAAQKLLSAADALYIEDAIYVGGVDGVASLYNPENILTLADGIYNVKSYINGEFVNSAVEGGEYIVQNSACITEFVAYKAPGNSLTFEDQAVGMHPEINGGTSKPTDLGIAGGLITKVEQISQGQTNAPYTSEIMVENGNKFIRSIKSKRADGTNPTTQTWINFYRDTGSAISTDEIAVNMRIRLSFVVVSSGAEIRLYQDRGGTALTNESATDGKNARIFIRSNGTNYYVGTSSAANEFNPQKKETVFNCTDSSDWMTMRITYNKDGVLTIYVLNENTTPVTFNGVEYGYGEYIPYYRHTYKAVSDLSTIGCISLMPSSACAYTLDVDDVYFGEALAFPSTPALTTENDSVGPVLNEIQPAWKGNAYSAIDIVTGDKVTIIDDLYKSNDSDIVGKPGYDPNGDGGQVIVRFNNPDGTTTSNTIVVDTAFKADVASNGNIYMPSGDSPCYRLQLRSPADGKYKDVIYVYPYTSNGKMAFSVSGAGGKATDIPLGEWFNIRLVYTYTPAVEEVLDENGEVVTPASAASAKAKVIFSDANGNYTEYEYNVPGTGYAVVMDPTTATAIRVSCVPNRPYAGMTCISGLRFSYSE